MAKNDKNKIFNNMKSLLNETKLEKKDVVSANEINQKEIENIINISLFKELTTDEKIIDLLLKSSIEIFKIQAKNVIELGKIFKNVFDELGGEGSKYTGLYEKWLVVNNISKSTALRYRKRYELYSSVTLDKKNIILLLPQKYIDLIYLEENKNKFIELINKGANKKEIMELIDNQEMIIPISEKTEEIITEFNYIPKFIKFSNEIDNKIKELDEKKKRDLQKYLKKIEELLK
ncbi:hypothetical protein [Candidatus Cetobacterium colombiensis]|uniref:Uncharacterized protein n=1 Tax=Candidatus Cetobacterium colombiensis TaxID=3073100 RepID=A0ABU4WG47_9FUSO|nr:hypothetical protein [Candidatus Cetobacterium colombiensis]MDX8337448.1 hypothetical protein [Candidatus Cetobacterium colombiensis]